MRVSSWVVFLYLVISSQSVLETALSFHVPARKEQCFYEDVKKGDEVEIDFQVIDGGDLDIDFSAYDGDLKRIAINRREQYGSHRFEVAKDGTYKVCFSNKFSKMTSKTVFMDVYVDNGVYEEDKTAALDASLQIGIGNLNVSRSS
eukprot:sb/3473884/